MHVVEADGAGFLGSHLGERLTAEGHETVCHWLQPSSEEKR